MIKEKKTQLIAKTVSAFIFILMIATIKLFAYESIRGQYKDQGEYYGGFAKPQVIMDAATHARLASKTIIKNKTSQSPKYKKSFTRSNALIDAATLTRLSRKAATKENINKIDNKLEKENTTETNESSRYVGIIYDPEEEVQQETYENKGKDDIQLQTVKPVASGWVEVEIEEIKNSESSSSGIQQLVRLVNNLVFGIGASSIISFAGSTDSKWDAISAESFENLYRTENVLDSIRKHLIG